MLATASDEKTGVDLNNDGTIDYYTANVVSANDYYPFGMMMPARTFRGGPGIYRYGFNGKENDKDITEGTQDYGMRISDNRLGRFLSVDPITAKYPELTPYQFASNRPIDGIDMDGLEYVTVRVFYDKNQPIIVLPKVTYEYHTNMPAEQIKRIHGMSAKNFYEKYSTTFGEKGQGVLYEYFEKSFWGGWNKVGQGWTQQQNGMKANIEYHGIYSGPGGPLTYGPGTNIEQGGPSIINNYTFSISAIDFPDEISRVHDIEYDEFTFQGYAGYKEDIRTLQADKNLMEKLMPYIFGGAIARFDETLKGVPIFGPEISIHENPIGNSTYRDPITGRPASKEAMTRALNMYQLFGEYLIPYKEWKLGRMMELGLDPSNPDHIRDNRVQVDQWDDKRAATLKDVL